MEGDQRRKAIICLLEETTNPISGASLATKLGVSRQIIVQDIALLRAINKNILSTNKGYLLFKKDGKQSCVQRSIKVCHESEQILDELYTIVDLGGNVKNVVIEHPIYGQILVDLIINSRKDANEFVKQVMENKTKPLTELTDGVHFHIIEAKEESILDVITLALKKKGYLISVT